jgi:hypothetical protein
MERVFVLSLASTSGKRAAMLMNDKAEFELAARLRTLGAPLGEVEASDDTAGSPNLPANGSPCRGRGSHGKPVSVLAKVGRFSPYVPPNWNRCEASWSWKLSTTISPAAGCATAQNFLRWRPDKTPKQCNIKQVKQESGLPLLLL